MPRTAAETHSLAAAVVSRVFLLDKPAGISSFAALGTLKRAIGTRKVGHAGTLDPFATGLLIAASGKLTKIAGLLTDMDKEYLATFRFGAETDTLDTEGEIIAEAPLPIWEDILRLIPEFSGDITQTPPVFSAIKINGRRAYESARKGQEVDIPERKVRIYDFEPVSWKAPDLEVRIRCSKGTYIRSIARDLGLAAGSRAYCLKLRRTSIGPFSVDNAENEESLISGGLEPVDFFKALGVEVFSIEDVTADRLRHGVPFQLIEGFVQPVNSSGLYVDSSGNAAALVVREGGKLIYRIVFD